MKCLKPFDRPPTAPVALPPRTSGPATTLRTLPEPTITNLGNGFYRVGIPATDTYVVSTAWMLPDAILTIAAIIERAAGLGLAA